MEKIIITKEQKKILMIVGIVGCAFLIFVIFIYLPLRREFRQVKGEFYRIESEVSEIKKAGGEGRSLEASIASLNNNLNIINRKFPEKEEAILRELSGLLGRLGI